MDKIDKELECHWHRPARIQPHRSRCWWTLRPTNRAGDIWKIFAWYLWDLWGIYRKFERYWQVTIHFSKCKGSGLESIVDSDDVCCRLCRKQSKCWIFLWKIAVAFLEWKSLTGKTLQEFTGFWLFWCDADVFLKCFCACLRRLRWRILRYRIGKHWPKI